MQTYQTLLSYSTALLRGIIYRTDIWIYQILTSWMPVGANNVESLAGTVQIKRPYVCFEVQVLLYLFRRQLSVCAAKHKTKLTYQTIPNTHHMELRVCIKQIK